MSAFTPQGGRLAPAMSRREMLERRRQEDARDMHAKFRRGGYTGEAGAAPASAVVPPSSSTANAAWVLAARPGAEGMLAENFRMEEVPMPEIGEGEVLLEAQLISVDPYMRGRMDDNASYFAAPFQIGEPPAGTVGATVVRSRHPEFQEGDVVTGFLPWQRFAKAGGAGLAKRDVAKFPLEKYMSSLSYSGLSSYLPIVHIGEPKEGETAFVSGAAGAVGSMACQIFKQMGCKVVGSAGSAAKVAFVESIGATAFNYKDPGPLSEKLKEACPDGIDIYFENVGGEMLEAVIDQMNNFGRIIACGMISQYDTPAESRYGVRNLFNVVTKRLKFQGYIMSDFPKEAIEEASVALSDMVLSGEVTTQETILDGFDKVPQAFLGLFKGENQGKMLVRCGDAASP